MHICGYVPPWLCQILACMGGCLGCFPNPHFKGQAMNKDISEDFWSSSAFEIDQSAFQSQKSFSSIVIPSDPQSSSGIQIDSPKFVNHGLLIWNQMRQHWVGNRRPENKREVGEPIIRKCVDKVEEHFQFKEVDREVELVNNYRIQFSDRSHFSKCLLILSFHFIVGIPPMRV